MDIAIAPSHLLHRYTELREGWSATLRLQEPFEDTVCVSLEFTCGKESWVPELQGSPFRPHHLPRSHRSKPLNRLFKQARATTSLREAKPNALAVWLVKEVWVHPLYFKHTVMEEHRYSLTLAIGESFRSVWSGEPGAEHPVFRTRSSRAA